MLSSGTYHDFADHGAELEGDEAIARSHQLSKLSGVKKALLWPYVGLIVALRLVSLGRTPLLAALPTHVVRDVPEIPFLFYCAFLFLSVVLSRSGPPIAHVRRLPHAATCLSVT